MTVKAGTVAFWRDLFPGHDKFVYFVGSYKDFGTDYYAFFTLSSQAKYSNTRLSRELVEIGTGTADYLDRATWIQCFHELSRISVAEFKAQEAKGYITFRGELPQFLPRLRDVVSSSDVLNTYDVECALDCLDRCGA